MNDPVIDRARIEDCTGGDEEFLRELVDIYLADADQRLEELKEALMSADEEAFKRVAHMLKGSSANMGAVSVSNCAKELEQLGRSHQLGPAADLMTSLEVEMKRVREELTRIAGI